MTLTWSEKTAVFTINQVEGDASLLPDKRTWTVVFRGWRKGCTFLAGGEPVAAEYDPQTNSYTVVLPPMEADRAVAIAVANEGGLLHDNSDFRGRVIDILTRAQMIQDEKSQLLKWVDDSLMLPPEKLRPLNTRPDLHPNLGAHLYELMMQLTR